MESPILMNTLIVWRTIPGQNHNTLFLSANMRKPSIQRSDGSWKKQGLGFRWTSPMKAFMVLIMIAQLRSPHQLPLEARGINSWFGLPERLLVAKQKHWVTRMYMRQFLMWREIHAGGGL